MPTMLRQGAKNNQSTPGFPEEKQKQKTIKELRVATALKNKKINESYVCHPRLSIKINPQTYEKETQKLRSLAARGR